MSFCIAAEAEHLNWSVKSCQLCGTEIRWWIEEASVGINRMFGMSAATPVPVFCHRNLMFELGPVYSVLRKWHCLLYGVCIHCIHCIPVYSIEYVYYTVYTVYSVKTVYTCVKLSQQSNIKANLSKQENPQSGPFPVSRSLKMFEQLSNRSKVTTLNMFKWS